MASNIGKELTKHVLCEHPLTKEMQLFVQKTVLHSLKRVNSIVKQHRLSIWLDIKAINQKQRVVSLFIFRTSFFLRVPLLFPGPLRVRYSAKETGIAQSAPHYLSWYLAAITLRQKTKQNRTFCKQMISQLKEQLSHKMYISSACSYCRCIHSFSHTRFPYYLFVL